MADGKDIKKSKNLVDLDTNYSTILKEIQELEVIISELESVKIQNNVYIKRGRGNLFFLDSNHQKTAGEYKRLLANKRKEIKILEEAIREQSCR